MRREKHARCEELARKKSMHEITQKFTTHVSQLDYFLVQLNFISYGRKKNICLMHNYCFYCETREICLMKQHKKHEITYTHVSHLVCFSHLINFLRIITFFVGSEVLNIFSSKTGTTHTFILGE